MPDDNGIADLIAASADVRLRRFDDFTGEGGALECDGDGTFITTRQCLMNKNRNPSLSEKEVEDVLGAALGAEKLVWPNDGLTGDHTDGHVDNLARFLAPQRLSVCGPLAAMIPIGTS